jgi:hypothetical protein
MDLHTSHEESFAVMNIFFLSLDPEEAARFHCNKHVVKMILETAQLLYTSHWVRESPLPEDAYKKTHPNHPSSRWIRESLRNYTWLCRLGLALCAEYTFRYGKIHVTQRRLTWLSENPPVGLVDIGWTLPRLAMPVEYHHADPIMAYRMYYVGAKTRLLTYTKRLPPEFLGEAVYMTAGGKSIPVR